MDIREAGDIQLIEELERRGIIVRLHDFTDEMLEGEMDKRRIAKAHKAFMMEEGD